MSDLFFNKVDDTNIAERHIRRIIGLETHQAELLIKNYSRARLELRERLKNAVSGSFTEGMLKEVLSQVEATLGQLRNKVRQEMVFGAEGVREQGFEDLTKELNTFRRNFEGIRQDIPLDAVITTLRPDNYLINQYRSSIESYNESLRNDIQRILTQAVIQRKTGLQAVDDLSAKMSQDEWKIARIVRTELHQIYNLSKIDGMEKVKQDTIPNLKKALIHPMDLRTGKDSKILANINPIVDIGQPFKYSFRQGDKTITRTFMAPPDRPNDRAILIPYSQDWETE
jgi:hypothetical protein